MLEEGWMWQNWALLLCYMIQAAQKVSSHPDVPLLMQADLWEPVYEPKGSRTATCPACLVNMLRLCGPSDLPTDTIHMCVSITLGNCSQGTAPQMIWAGSELYRMEEMKQRPDKQHLDDNAHTHTHTDTLTIFAMSGAYKLYHFPISKAIQCTCATRKLYLYQILSQTIMKNQTMWL